MYQIVSEGGDAEGVEVGGLAAELVERMGLDQRVRSEVTGREPSDEFWARVAEVDADNAAWFAEVLDEYGWPRRSEVGSDAATAAWLIAQHGDRDREFQRRCLSLLDQAVRDGEAQPSHLAYLTDRMRRADGRPQLYGTQFWYGPDGGGPLQPQPIEDPDQLDERRRSVGMGPFAEYVTLMRQRESPDEDRARARRADAASA
ncbi:DUF6624 domain-containing protein [Micromonospora sp. WMMA1923]|uniref:DUF6624 domain-containing protein n=1 Tax=Micromonospora sp. WMMA1923 TaxID=3404125 RepID=UPI003B94FBB5